jgi:phosphoenolpyruvate-protein kinase (PTS system EI component)
VRGQYYARQLQYRLICTCIQMAEELGVHTLPRIGAMLETSAALSVPTLKQHVDFFSIGSNDLTQYTLAAGRENPPPGAGVFH